MGRFFHSAFCQSQEFFGTVRQLRAPLILAVASFAILSTPAQILELYLSLARDLWGSWLQVLLALVSLVGLSLFITYVARELTRPASDHEVTPPSPLRRVLPVVLGSLPLLGAALGLYLALTSATTPTMRTAVETFDALKSQDKLTEAGRRVAAYFKSKGREPPEPVTSATFAPDNLVKGVRKLVPGAILDAKVKSDALQVAMYIAILLCLAFALALAMLFARRQLQPVTRRDFLGVKAFPPAVRYPLYIVGVALVALFAAQSLNVGQDYELDFTAIPRALGTLFLVNLCLVFVIFFCSVLTRTQERYKIPVLTLVVVAAFVFSYLDLNDNHTVRFVSVSQDDLVKRKVNPNAGLQVPGLVDAFTSWLAARPTEHVQKYANRRYPIFIVAAQGGGMYAANLSGLFLARLYDRCPAIRHHLFAVSGVSGGSIGAGYFSALLNEPGAAPLGDTCNLLMDGKGPLERKIEPLLQKDLLAPVAAGFLFPDLVQRFVPVPIEAFDRARAFEAGLEQAWTSTIKSKSNPLRRAFWEHWSADGPSPMLLLNTTVVETGRQAVVSPVRLIVSDEARHLASLHEALGLNAEQDVPLSTAMSLSARFPLVMPAGLVRTPTGQFRLVDGGIFENSAADTAAAVIQQLRKRVSWTCGEYECTFSEAGETDEQARARPKFSFRIITLTDYDFFGYWIGDTHATGRGLNEILSPVRAMLNSRIARADLAIIRPGEPMTYTSLEHRIYKLPLGLQLSPHVQSIIAAQIGDRARCLEGFEGRETLSSILDSVLWVEKGLELLRADREKRPAAISTSWDYLASSPTRNMLKLLHENHCAHLSFKDYVSECVNYPGVCLEPGMIR